MRWKILLICRSVPTCSISRKPVIFENRDQSDQLGVIRAFYTDHSERSDRSDLVLERSDVWSKMTDVAAEIRDRTSLRRSD